MRLNWEQIKFESFCQQVADMMLKEDRPFVIASVEATWRATMLIANCEIVDAVALFGKAAVDRAEYDAKFVLDPRLFAGFIYYHLPDPVSFPGEAGYDPEPEPFVLPAGMEPWFILAVRDPNMAHDGRNLLLHGNIHGSEGDPNDGE